MKSLRRNMGLLFCVASLALLVLQITLYRQYAAEMTLLYVREIVGAQPHETSRRMAAVCNSLQRFNCALRSFTKLLKDNPNDSSALSNIGMIHSMQGKYFSALPFLRAYFAGGGQGLDVYYWYAKSLHLTGETEEALKVYYQALSYRDYQKEAVEAIFTILEKEHRYIEAMSFIHSLNDFLIEEEVRQMLEIKKALMEPFVRQEKLRLMALEELRFPSFDGQNFTLPLSGSVSALTRVEVLDLRSPNRIDERKLNELNVRYWSVGPNRVRVPDLKVLGHSLGQVDFELCADCGIQLRRDVFRDLSPRIETRPALSFLVLQTPAE